MTAKASQGQPEARRGVAKAEPMATAQFPHRT